MLETSIIIAVVVAGASLLGYMARIFVLSKCCKTNKCECNIGKLLNCKCNNERDTANEVKNVSQMNLDIGKSISL